MVGNVLEIIKKIYIKNIQISNEIEKIEKNCKHKFDNEIKKKS